jgi:uncharacterized protein (TIGR03437 family)
VDGAITGSTPPLPILPVSVQIGGLDAIVEYAGAAPGIVAGVLQVNARIPDSAHAGPAVSVVVKVGGKNSQPGVTVAVK